MVEPHAKIARMLGLSTHRGPCYFFYLEATGSVYGFIPNLQDIGYPARRFRAILASTEYGHGHTSEQGKPAGGAWRLAGYPVTDTARSARARSLVRRQGADAVGKNQRTCDGQSSERGPRCAVRTRSVSGVHDRGEASQRESFATSQPNRQR